MGAATSFLVSSSRHQRITLWLLVETGLVFAGLGAVALALYRAPYPTWLWAVPVMCAQGCWLQRVYLVGHEAVHRKLWPGRPRLNDAVGQLVLAPLMIPLRVYRKIHAYHHGRNRADFKTSALDTFVVRPGAPWWYRAGCRAVWYLAVFAGGFFLHGVFSILFFLLLPLGIARRVSPAFKGWKERDRAASLLAFGFGLSVHVGVFLALGADGWLAVLGWPLLAFAWVYSVLVYIYHYRTSYGRQTRFNVRSLRPAPLASWWLLCFNEHATHHADPSLPWYRLPEARVTLPGEYADNQQVHTVFAAILHQLRGPNIVEAESDA